MNMICCPRAAYIWIRHLVKFLTSIQTWSSTCLRKSTLERHTHAWAGLSPHIHLNEALVEVLDLNPHMAITLLEEQQPGGQWVRHTGMGEGGEVGVSLRIHLDKALVKVIHLDPNVVIKLSEDERVGEQQDRHRGMGEGARWGCCPKHI